MEKRAVLIGNCKSDWGKEKVSYVLYIEEYLKEKEFSIEWIWMSKKEDRRKLTEAFLGDAELLVTFGLAGFEISTQSGSFLYNILPCKSIHFILPKEDLLTKLENRKISIALFFVCLTDEPLTFAVNDGYGGRPWMKCCPPKEKRIKAVLDEILDEIFFFRHTDGK